jgi:hypothetical protein
MLDTSRLFYVRAKAWDKQKETWTYKIRMKDPSGNWTGSDRWEDEDSLEAR